MMKWERKNWLTKQWERKRKWWESEKEVNESDHEEREREREREREKKESDEKVKQVKREWW